MRHAYLLFILLLLFFSIPTFGWSVISYDFTVIILDENHSPLMGVNVFTDDYNFTATSDEEGKVVLKDIDNREEVNFTYIGYQDQKVPFYEIRRLSGKVRMLPEVEELEQVVVIGRRDDTPEEIPFIVESVTQKEIAFSNPQTAADALSNEAGVFVQKSQMGGGSPVIRGFEANKVLLVLDGVRMNNAIYRNGHLQNAITLDNAMLERVEVIFGPGSLMYGSDAFGGVVHFRSRDPKLFFGDEKGRRNYYMESNAYTRYSSANQEFTGHFDVNYGSKYWGSLTSISFSDFGHMEAGSKRPEAYPNFGKRYFFAKRDGVDQIKPNLNSDGEENFDLQRGTEYTQVDFLQKVRYQPSDKLYFVGNLQYSTSSNIPRYDQLTVIKKDSSDLKFIDWYYGPQQRFLASIKARTLQATPLYDRATIIAAFQKIDEERYQRKFANLRRKFNKEDVSVYSLTADFDKFMDVEHRKVISYGVDLNHNQVDSEGGNTNIRTGAKSGGVSTRYPSGGSTMTTAGAYVNYRLASTDSLMTINAGLRYSYATLNAVFSATDPIPWPENYYTTGIGTTDNDLTGAIGLTYKTPSKWQIRLLAGTAFRSPNIDDFAKIRVKSGFVTIPNPSLSSEKAINGEMTIGKEIGQLNRLGDTKQGTLVKMSVTGFYTRLTDAIVRQTYPLTNGETTLLIDEEINTTIGNVNADNSIIYGASANFDFNINDNWLASANVNYTKGRKTYTDSLAVGDTDIFVPIDTIVAAGHIAPLYGKASLAYQNKRFKIEGVVRFNGAKPLEEYEVLSIEIDNNGGYIFNRGGSSDNLEDATADGTYAWTTYNLYTSWSFNEQVSLNFAIENITDIHYRPFSSGVSAAGRNFILSLRGKF